MIVSLGNRHSGGRATELEGERRALSVVCDRKPRRCYLLRAVRLCARCPAHVRVLRPCKPSGHPLLPRLRGGVVRAFANSPHPHSRPLPHPPRPPRPPPPPRTPLSF